MHVNKVSYPGERKYVNDYEPYINAWVSLEHASAAYRTFHTYIRGCLQLVTEQRDVVGKINISDWMLRPVVLQYNDNLENLARGLITEPMGLMDQYWSRQITQFLFKQGNDTSSGRDLRADDIQRGRDHGLGTYVAARKLCNLSVPKQFSDMTDIAQENVKILQDSYSSVDDVDLVTAGSLEFLVPGAQTGPTFLCILTDQFLRTRIGDRYFYERGDDPLIAFKPDQLNSIRDGASLAALLCDNVHIQQSPRLAMNTVGDNNKLTPCEDLPRVDLSLWKE